MLSINKEEFIANLRLTQVYCARQLQQKELSHAKILRSINPVYQGEKFFTFPFSTEAEWPANTDPYNEQLFATLFEQQLTHKAQAVTLSYSTEPTGKIAVADYEESVTDGASQSISLGLFDVYDCPPVDTWFYRADYEGRQLLFAWIPEPFVEVTKDVMDVNPVDDIGWFSDWFPEEYRYLFGAH
jgi:hypothetical protein